MTMGGSMPREMGMLPMGMSNGHGGRLYVQTNEIRNSMILCHRLVNGTLTEVERVATGGAGSGTYEPISGQESAPNAFKWYRVLRYGKGFGLFDSVRFGLWLARGCA